MPRARIEGEDGKTTEWRSKARPRYQWLTRRAEALIAAVYLAGTNTRRGEAEKAIFQWTIAPPNAGAVRAVPGRCRQGRRQPGLAEGEGGLGRVVCAQPRGRGHRPPDPRRHGDPDPAGQEGHQHLGAGRHRRAPGWARQILLSIRHMGGESPSSSSDRPTGAIRPALPDRPRPGRQFLDDLDARGLKRPDFVIVDGAPGLEAALTVLWGEDLPIERCTVHKHRNLLAHAPKHLHDELTEAMIRMGGAT